MQENPTNQLKEIDLSNNYLNDDDSDIFMMLIDVCQNLVEIKFAYNDISSETQRKIAVKLSPRRLAHLSHRLKSFSLLQNKLIFDDIVVDDGDEPLKIIVEFLSKKTDNQLEIISLKQAVFSEYSHDLLLQLIDICQNLREINLNWRSHYKKIATKLSQRWVDHYLRTFDFLASTINWEARGISTFELKKLINFLINSTGPNLITIIDLSGNNLIDDDLDLLLELLEVCPNLIKLNLSNNEFKKHIEKQIQIKLSPRWAEHFLKTLDPLTKKLDWNNEKITGDALRVLIGFLKTHPKNQLEEIGLQGNFLVDKDLILLLQLIDLCPNLSNIDFGWISNLKSETQKQIQAKLSIPWIQRYLSTFNFSDNHLHLSEKGMGTNALNILLKVLKANPQHQIDTIYLAGNCLRDHDLDKLYELIALCPKLKEIYLAHNDLTQHVEKEVLEKIQISLSARWIKHYLKIFNFSEPEIRWQARGISAAELKELIKFVTDSVSSNPITSIDLSENNLVDDDLNLLLELAEVCPSLIKINLSDNKFKENIEKQIRAVLSPRWVKNFLDTFNPQTKKLNCDYQNINATALGILIDFLKSHPENQLEEIGLKENSLVDEDFILLLQLIDLCPNLNEIDIDWDKKHAGVIEKQVKAKLCEFWMERYLRSFDFSETVIRYESTIASSALKILVDFFKNHPNQIEAVHLPYAQFDSDDSVLLYELAKACPKLRELATNLSDVEALEYSILQTALEGKIFTENKNIMLESLLSARQLEYDLNRLAPTETKLRIASIMARPFYFPSGEMFKVIAEFLLKRSHQINYIQIPVVSGFTIHVFEPLIHAIEATLSITRIKLVDIDSLIRQGLKEDFRRFPEKLHEFENKFGIKIEIDKLQIKENELLNTLADRLEPILQKNIRYVQQKAYRLLAIARILFNLTATNYSFAKFNLQIIKYIFSFLNDEGLFSSGQVEKIIYYAQDRSTLSKNKSEFIDKISNYKQFSGLQKFWTKNLVNSNLQPMAADVSVPQLQPMSEENLKSESSSSNTL